MSLQIEHAAGKASRRSGDWISLSCTAKRSQGNPGESHLVLFHRAILVFMNSASSAEVTGNTCPWHMTPIDFSWLKHHCNCKFNQALAAALHGHYNSAA